MNVKQAGFTLIELVMVIVILGILAAVAIPKFIDLSSDAKTAAVSGVAGALASGAAANYAGRSVSSSYGSALTACANIASVLTGGLPAGYGASGASSTVAGTALGCTVTSSSGTGTFTAIAIN